MARTAKSGRLPNDLADAFKDVKISDDPEENRENAERKVAAWLDSVTGDLERAG